MRYLILAVLILAETVDAAPSPHRCAKACSWVRSHCMRAFENAPRWKRCDRGIVARCGGFAACLPSTTTSSSTSSSTERPTTTSTSTSSSTAVPTTIGVATSTTSTTLPDLTGWYRGTFTQGSQCLDDPGHTGYTPPPPFEVTIHFVGFAADRTAHYTMSVTGPYVGNECIGGWDTGAPADLTRADNDPECICETKYFGAWPPAECGDGGVWSLIGGSSADLSVDFTFGQPWECNSSFHGTLLPIAPPS